MKIHTLQIENVLGARSVSITPDNPVVLVAGDNFAGKSSVRDAFALALTGEPTRVKLKKDYGQLMTIGRDSGKIAVEWDGGRATVALPSGKRGVEGETSPFLPFVLDPAAFGALDASLRRTLLFKLLGVETAPETVVKRLLAACNEHKVGAIAHLLHSGMEVACKRAKEHESEAKGAWKEITGEPYGSKKADTWAPEAAEPVDAAEIEAEQKALDDTQAQGEALTAERATLIERRRVALAQRGRIEALKDIAGRLQRGQDKLAADQANLAELQERLDALPAQGDSHPQSPCPECGAVLAIHGIRLEKVAGGKIDPEVEELRAKLTEAVALMRRSIEKDEAAIRASLDAQAQLADTDAVEMVSDEQIHAIDARVEILRAARKRHADRLAELKSANGRAEHAATAQSRAASRHLDVQEWHALAEKLGPDGLMLELVEEALLPLNKSIAANARAAQWPAPQILADMSVMVDGKHRALLSESEGWRADALVAASLSQIAEIGVLFLDRWDVLNLAGREDALYWLAESGLQAFVFGTLKAKPAKLPEGCECVWIEKGVVLEERRAAA